MKRFLALVLSLILAVGVFAGTIKPLKGFDKRVYDASYALSATSVERNITEPKLLCTITAFEKYREGYLFIGAGHCTTVNPRLPSDLKYSIKIDVNTSPQPIELITAKLLNEDFEDTKRTLDTLDYAIFYLKTTTKISTIALGDEGSLRIGGKTINVNFSEGQAKYVSPGIVSTAVVPSGVMKGFFGVQMFGSHGASGSSIVDSKTKQIVGLLIGGNDGETLPSWIEPITRVEADLVGANLTGVNFSKLLDKVNFGKLIDNPEIPNVQRPQEVEYIILWN